MEGKKFDQDKVRLELLPLEFWCIFCYDMSDRPFTKAHDALITVANFNSRVGHTDLESVFVYIRDELDISDAQLALGIGQVMTFGAKKYDDHNWLKGMKWSRLIGAAMRHIVQYLDGSQPNEDAETGINHLYHAACCVTFLMTYANRGLGEDDRYVP